MAEPLMMATVGVSGVDAVLALALLFVYARNYRRVRAPFTIGLLLVAAVFLAQNLLAVYAYATMMEIVPSGLVPYMLGIASIQGVALATMVVSANT